MKATGIVRRIDDLGRVVIPKEIRRTMRIREGDPLEIYTDREGEVIFKKYSPIGEMSTSAAQYADTLHKVGGMAVIVCDRDAVIACAGLPRKEYADRRLSPELEELISARSFYQRREGDPALPAVPDDVKLCISCAMPIIAEGDLIGCVASLSGGDTTRSPEIAPETEAKLIRTAASFLGKQLES